METKGEKEKINLSLGKDVVRALRKYALETTGHSRGTSDVAEQAIVEFLEKHGVIIGSAKNKESLNPLVAQALNPVFA